MSETGQPEQVGPPIGAQHEPFDRPQAHIDGAPKPDDLEPAPDAVSDDASS